MYKLELKDRRGQQADNRQSDLDIVLTDLGFVVRSNGNVIIDAEDIRNTGAFEVLKRVDKTVETEAGTRYRI